MDNRVISAVYRAIDHVNELLPEEKKIAKSLESDITEEKGGIDSFAFVNLIVAVEDKIEEELKSDIRLLGSEYVTSFKSIKDLVEHISKQDILNSNA